MFVLIGASLLVALGFLAAFFFALRSGQFDDLFTPAVRMLFEPRKSNKRKSPTDRSSS